MKYEIPPEGTVIDTGDPVADAVVARLSHLKEWEQTTLRTRDHAYDRLVTSEEELGKVRELIATLEAFLEAR